MPPEIVQPESYDEFGGYTVLSRLATGGMAEIFLAREQGERSGQFIVIKRLLPHIAQHPELIEMFLDEGRVAATLDHPNIVDIYNVGAVGEHYFLTMEHLVGLDLTRVCSRLWNDKRVLPLNHTVYVLTCILDGLDYAHEMTGRDGKPLGIVHRDVSPHNIFLSFDGNVKLLDFGVARAANALHHTKTGALVGKLSYMSPEQSRGEKLDRRSDLFSVGIVLYELTTGQRLYNTKKLGEFEVLRRICETDVKPPSELRENYPPEIEKVVLRALAKAPEDRFQTAREFEKALRAAAKSLGLLGSAKSLSEFLKKNFSDEITKTERRLERLKTVGTGDTVVTEDEPEPAPTPTPSGKSRRASVYDDDDATQRRVRSSSSRHRKVAWRRIPSPSTAPPSPPEQPAGHPTLSARSFGQRLAERDPLALLTIGLGTVLVLLLLVLLLFVL